MQKFSYKTLFLMVCLIVFSSCDEGLSPSGEKGKTIVRWTINYIGGEESWRDSVYKEIRAVAFKIVPDSNTNIVQEILEEKAYISNDSLPAYVGNTVYEMEIPETPLELRYLAVVKRYGENFFADWRVIGIYAEDKEQTKPKSLIVTEGRTYDIEINVNLHDLPPQPFE